MKSSPSFQAATLVSPLIVFEDLFFSYYFAPGCLLGDGVHAVLEEEKESSVLRYGCHNHGCGHQFPLLPILTKNKKLFFPLLCQ